MVGFFNVGRSIHVGLRKINVAWKDLDSFSPSITAGNSFPLSIVSQFPNIKRSYLSCAPHLEHSEIVER